MQAIKLTFSIILWGILLAIIFRFLLIWSHKDEIWNDSITTGREWILFILSAIKYDVLILSFILFLPYLLLTAYDYIGRKILKEITFWWIFTGMFLYISIWAADVTYFNKFYQHITLKAFEWMDTPGTVAGMILQDPQYRAMFVPGLLIIGFTWFLLRWMFFKEKSATTLQAWKKILYHLLFFALLITGLRGTITGHPLRMEDAYLFHNNMLNKLALNPLFVLEKSMENAFKNDLDSYQFMDNKEAFRIVRKYLRAGTPVNANPVSRYYHFEMNSAPKPRNVVIVLMESMAAWKMKYFGNTEIRTPFLDSLFLESLSFSNMYSAGIHTYGGIYATHFSYPLLYGHHPLKGIFLKEYYSLPQILKEKGYTTLFFLPHNKRFDNVGAFLTLNAFDTIYYDMDYPASQKHNVWGVDDRFLLQFALKKIDQLAARDKPFLVSVLTVSDHRPFYIPEDIKGENDEIRATRFADKALQEFFEKAKTKPWFDNTIFVFMADHGEPRQSKYPVALTYSRIPALIYYQGVRPQIINKIAGQIDIFPVLMHILGYDYLNMTFGMDLLEEDRKYILFNHDGLYGVADREYLLVADKNRTLGLYRHAMGDRTDYSAKEPEKRKEMETVLKAHLQTVAQILQHNLQSIPISKKSNN